MARIESDAPGPGQDMASEIIDRVSRIYEQDNTKTVRWVPSDRGVMGNEIANIYAKESAKGKAPDSQSQKAMERISLAYLKRKAAEKVARQWRSHILKFN